MLMMTIHQYSAELQMSCYRNKSRIITVYIISLIISSQEVIYERCKRFLYLKLAILFYMYVEFSFLHVHVNII